MTSLARNVVSCVEPVKVTALCLLHIFLMGPNVSVVLVLHFLYIEVILVPLH